MTTNREWLYSLDVADLPDWFDAEHVENTRSAKRAAAVERVRKAKDAGTSIGYAIVGREYYPWEAYETLIELLTDDDGLRNNDGVAAEHGATRMTNLERLFVDSEQFRQAVSAFAFAHSDDCPTSPTQMVDWLMAPYVDAQSKDQSKMEPSLTEQSEYLSDDLGHPTDMSQKSADCVRNDGKMSETGVSANDVDANDENATFNNSGDFVTDDTREKLEVDVRQYANPSGGTGTLGACWEKKMLEFLDRQDEITRDETIRTYNIAAREARKVQEKRIAELQARVDELQADNDELRKRFSEIAELNGYAWQEGFEKGCESRDDAIADWRAENDRLHDELAKRDKGIVRLKRQRDTARAKIDELEAECDTCCYKTDYIEMDFLDVDRLEAERDALAHDLQDCEQQRERLRQALGIAIDRAHEVVSLVNLDGEVIK